MEVVKIDFKTDRPVNIVEKQLTEQKRAVTYGIYFDFNKDTIKPESEPVLKQIVQAMTDNPTWKLTVEGHTDNIGSDPTIWTCPNAARQPLNKRWSRGITSPRTVSLLMALALRGLSRPTTRSKAALETGASN